MEGNFLEGGVLVEAGGSWSQLDVNFFSKRRRMPGKMEALESVCMSRETRDVSFWSSLRFALGFGVDIH
jgi:hypothetical protein